MQELDEGELAGDVDPNGQEVHAEAKVLPVLELYVFAGQIEQLVELEDNP